MANLYLIPCPISEKKPAECLPPEALQALQNTKVFLVENLRSARRFISSCKLGITIDELAFFELNKKTSFDTVLEFLATKSEDIGVISEAGCPAVADPGSVAVVVAHELGMKVVPLIGPSSILLTLMASGFNGQSFAFHGYLPINQKERGHKLKQLESKAFKEKQTQLFMDTPYRNNQVFETILNTCLPTTRLCVASELTSSNEWIKTLTVERWKKQKIDLHKKPVIFALYI